MPAHDPYAPARTRPLTPGDEPEPSPGKVTESDPNYEALQRTALIDLAHTRGLLTWGTKRQLIDRLLAYDRR